MHGGQLAVTLLGADGGEPVLFVSGGPGEARAWRYLLPELDDPPGAPHHHPLRIAVFDRRGVGGSAALAPPRTATEIGEDALFTGRAVLDERFHVVGISVGGMAALELAARHPEAVASLVLVATTSGGASATPPDDAYLANVLTPPDDPDAAMRENLALALSPDWPTLNADRFDQLVADLAASPPVSDDANDALVEVFLSHDVSDRLSDVVAPTLVVGCEHDLVIPIPNSEHLAENIPGARLVTVPTGHAVDVEAADLLLDLIAGHVAAHPAVR